MSESIRIGNAQAFWGDRPSAAKELLVQVPELDYLTMDYLAEVSMSILALQRERNPQLGYPQDFVEVVRGLAPYWSSGGKCKLIANAGGLSPQACAEACRAALESAGCRSLKIGIVGGDDVLEILKQSLCPEGYRNVDTDEPLSSVQDRLVTANAYMGCSGIVDALKMGADIVITGRVADPSMVLAACVHHFHWKNDDWDRLAAGTLAGHLLECGTHATGGISTDWLSVPSPVDIGFPIAEVSPDGGLVITKSASSGGCVTVHTVKEQLLYEISDPGRYISPDVEVSFLGLSVKQIANDRVEVRGAKGCKHPETLKVSATYRDGYRAAGTLTIIGQQAVAKGYRCGEIVLKRLEDAGWNYSQRVVECLGSGASIPILQGINANHDPFETVLRIAVESPSKEAVEAFSKELIPLVTAGPQGTTGYAQGRPSVSPVFRYWPCLIESKLLAARVHCIESDNRSRGLGQASSWPAVPVPKAKSQETESTEKIHSASAPQRLISKAYGRSGDKGMNANIGILARSSSDYAWLKSWLTADRVLDYFKSMGVQRVERYEVPNLEGLNFIVYGILRCSIRNDAQGKGLAQALLAMPIEEARAWVDGLTIGQVLRETAARCPNQDAVVFPHIGWRATWSEFDRQVDQVARSLLALGFRRGDHFGIWATNIPAWVLLQFATARIGVVLVTINPSYRTEELSFVIGQADLKGLALIDHYKTTHYFESLQEAIPELEGCVPGRISSSKFPNLKTVICLRGDAIEGGFSWEDFLKLADRVSIESLRSVERELHCSDPINIQYTSGTTGSPKGAMLSHRNILLNAYYAGQGQAFTPSDRLCVPVPLYHCFGCVLGTLCGIVHAVTMVFPAETFQAAQTLLAIDKEKCTAVYGVPTMFIAMLEHSDYTSRDLRSLRTGIMAGSPCPIELMRKVTEQMGAWQMTIGYGQTEASPLITQTCIDDPIDLRVGTVGRVLDGVEVKIVDPGTSQTLGFNESGELCARGHNVMSGYYKMSEKTSQAIDAEGWLHTGDVALQEPNGYFRITGRIKDLVIRGGENIFPREIEEVLYRHPAVKEVQVIGVPDRKFGEEVMAWVSFRQGYQATIEELKAFCKERLAYFKVPHYWKFTDQFPTTVTGKIQKFRMREISIQELGLQAVADIETA